MDAGRSMRAVKDGLSASFVEIEESEDPRWTCADEVSTLAPHSASVPEKS